MKEKKIEIYSKLALVPLNQLAAFQNYFYKNFILVSFWSFILMPMKGNKKKKQFNLEKLYRLDTKKERNPSQTKKFYCKDFAIPFSTFNGDCRSMIFSCTAP
jgi:hypothetical protein